MKRLFLLDAYALIYRSYYAFIKNPRFNSKGENTSAIFGFVNTLEDVLKREQPSHMAVCFDPPGPTFRHEAYEAYKAQREETPEVIRWSIPKIKEIIQAYQIPILEVTGFEADDVIGTLAKKAAKKGYDVYMMTPDKDYGQLVEKNIHIYKPKYGVNDFEVLGPDEIMKKYELENPLQVIDLLGLMGDSSDNIPGCPGVGEVTAKKLLKTFGSIEAMLERSDELKGSLHDKITQNSEQIRFSKFLATIKIDVPIELNEEALTLREKNESELLALYDQLEFRSRIQKIQRENPKQTQYDLFGQVVDQKNAPEISKFEDKDTGETENSTLASYNPSIQTYHIIDNQDKLSDFLDKLNAQNSVCLDTETTHIDAMRAELVGMSFSWKKNEAWYLPFPSERKEAIQLLEKMKPFFDRSDLELVGQNLKYDLLVLRSYGIQINASLFDTMLAHYLIQPELRHGMDYLAEIYLRYQTIHIEDLIGSKGKNQGNMRDVSLEKIGIYAAEDADITWQLKEILKKELQEQQLEALFYDMEMPLVQVLVDMEYQGVELDTFSLAQSSMRLNQQLSLLEHEIQQLAGTSFNVNSPKQIGEILFDVLKINAKAKKTKGGQYSTSEDVLESLRSEHPIIEKILEQRKLKKLLSTYIDALPSLINPKTGNIHTSYNQAVTATGRLSSSNPNLQNIPIREALGREIRKAFTAGQNAWFLSADYSQIELRLMAHLSEDPHMIEAFRNDLDIHTATAAKLFNCALDEVNSDMRRKAKTANFGIIYGISVFGLAERMGVSRTEAKELIDGYFANYPQVKAYMDSAIEKAKKNGWVETLFKRKRFLSDIHSKNAVVRGYAERNAINAPIQGTAADIIKIAMIRVWKRMKAMQLQSTMILQVHDELNFIVPENERSIMQQLVQEEMEHAVTLNVPLKVEAALGKNWLEAHS
ncbi:MAG: DNA polymerase I [Bacteroidales bacterium]